MTGTRGEYFMGLFDWLVGRHSKSSKPGAISVGPVCICDSTNQELTVDEVYAISPRGSVPADADNVYRLLCKEKFVELYSEHGFQPTPEALARSHTIAIEHLRLKGRI